MRQGWTRLSKPKPIILVIVETNCCCDAVGCMDELKRTVWKWTKAVICRGRWKVEKAVRQLIEPWRRKAGQGPGGLREGEKSQGPRAVGAKTSPELKP